MSALLDEVSRLPYGERIARMVAAGKDPRAAADIDALEKGDAFARWLAVWSCHGSKDGRRVLRALHDSSALVRGLALRAVVTACDDVQAFDAFQIAWGMRRDKNLLARLREEDRFAVVDRALDWLAERPGIHDFADGVPLGSKAAVRKHLARALERPSMQLWERLARYHADVLGQVLAERIAAAPGESDPVTRQLTATHHVAIAQSAPREALAIAELLAARGIDTADGVWRALWKTNLEEVLAFFEARGKTVEHLRVRSERVAKLPHDLLGRLVRANATLGLESKSIDDARRRAIAKAWLDVADRFPAKGTKHLRWLDDAQARTRGYELWRAAAMDRDGVIPLGAVAELPADLREREARRHIHEVVALRTRPLERVAYARHLPWDEAQAAVAEQLGHPEGGNRATAIATLLGIAGAPEGVDETIVDRALELVVQRRFEQDPVRAAMLTALVAWPRETWKPKHTKAVEQIIRHALDASDLSSSTAWYAERLVVRTFRLDPKWGAALLGTWTKERGQIQDPRLGAHLTPDEIRAAADVLAAIVKEWLERDRFPIALSLAQSLGDHVGLLPGIFDVLAKARDACPWGGWAEGFANLIREHDPARHERDLPALVRRWLDKGWYNELTQFAAHHDDGDTLHDDLVLALERIVEQSGTQVQVLGAIHVLRRKATKRFAERLGAMLAKDKSLAVLPDVYTHLHRRRQDLLTPYLEGQVVTGRFATGNTSWILPFTSAFWRWTNRQNALFGIQHAAVVADVARDTPTVLRSLVVLPELCWAPMDDLTGFADDARPVVQEKAIRILSRCDQGQGIPTLIACLGDQRARFAIYGLRRALASLPAPRAFAILKDAPMTKVTVAKEVLRLMGELRSDDAYAHLLALDGTTLHRDVRIALLRALWDHLEREPTWAIFERAVDGKDWVMASRLGDIPADRLTKTTDAKLSRLLARLVQRDEPEARLALLQRAPYLAVHDRERTFLTACRARIVSPYDDEVQAAINASLMRSDETDIPALRETFERARGDARTMAVAVATLVAYGTGRRVYVLAAGAAEEVTKADPLLAALSVRCARLARPLELADVLAGLGALSWDVLAEARATIDSVRIDDLAALEDRLGASPDAEIRRLAVHALARDAGKDRGWTEERLARLRRYRADGSPVVSSAANAIWPPRELATKDSITVA